MVLILLGACLKEIKPELSPEVITIEEIDNENLRLGGEVTFKQKTTAEI